MNTDITSSRQTVLTHGPVEGTFDTSALSGDYTLYLTISGLGNGQSATIAIEDTVSSEPFSDAQAQATISVTGEIGAAAPVTVSCRKYQVGQSMLCGPGSFQTGSHAPRVGVAESKLRTNVTKLGPGPGLTLHVWIEQ